MQMIEYLELHLKRVPYGKNTTPFIDREYTVKEFDTAAVGNIQEIADFCKSNGLVKVTLIYPEMLDDGTVSINFDFEEELI